MSLGIIVLKLIKAIIGFIVLINLYEVLNSYYGGATYQMYFQNTLVATGFYVWFDVLKELLESINKDDQTEIKK